MIHRRRPAAFVAAALLIVASGCDSCRERIPVDSVERLPYPSCGEGALPEGELIGSGHLRAGPNLEDQTVVERFEIRKRDCLVFVTVHQAWPLDTADVEAIYDADLRPLRVWKRQLLPYARDPAEHADIRLYELRTDPPTLTWRRPDGKIEYRQLKGGRPEALVGPGLGLLSVWIREADLEPGGKSRKRVLDFRKEIEDVEMAALTREKDQVVPDLGRKVRVYTLYGRESVFANDDGIVIGDLRGMRPAESLKTPPPPPLPKLPPPDPVHAP